MRGAARAKTAPARAPWDITRNYSEQYPIDSRIATLAARQHGHVTRKQLLSRGIDDDGISYRLKTGRLHRVYPGVYAVGHRRESPVDRAAAAVLACGSGAVLSHLSAAALWGWVRQWREPFEVTTTCDRRPRAIRVHRSGVLEVADRTRQLGIPVTSPARTVLDCAPHLDDARLTRLINDALQSLYLSRGALAELLVRCGRRTGASRLIPFVLAGGRPTRSEFEDAFGTFIKRFGLPEAEINVQVNGREVDAFFRAEGVIVELDGYAFHSSWPAFERDRGHDADALATGLVTVRITWHRLINEAEAEADRLHAILRRRRSEGEPS